MTIQNNSFPFPAVTPVKSQERTKEGFHSRPNSPSDRQPPTPFREWGTQPQTEPLRSGSLPPSTPDQRIERQSYSAIDLLAQSFYTKNSPNSLPDFFSTEREREYHLATPLLATPLTKEGDKEAKTKRSDSLNLSKLEPALFEEINTELKTPVPPTPQSVTPISGHAVFHTTDPKERKTLSNISNLWGETARARFLDTRDRLTPQKQASQDDSEHDRSQMSDYIDVIKYFQGKANPQDRQHFLALIDSAQNVQGLAKLTEKQGDEPHLYLNALLTAAWNLPQRGETPTKLRSIPQAKGTGTALVAASCQLARQLSLTELRTSPSARAKSFYTETLEMPYNAETQTCGLDLTKELPKRLEAMKQIPLTTTASYKTPPKPLQSSDDDGD